MEHPNFHLPLSPEEVQLLPYLQAAFRAGVLLPGDSMFTTTIPDLDLPLCFNIRQAEDLAIGQPCIELPLDAMAGIIANYYTDPAKVKHVDYTVPGIAAQIWSPYDQTTIAILIDGAHRCAAALARRQLFLAYCLSVEDSYACLMVAPEVIWANRHRAVDQLHD